MTNARGPQGPAWEIIWRSWSASKKRSSPSVLATTKAPAIAHRAIARRGGLLTAKDIRNLAAIWPEIRAGSRIAGKRRRQTCEALLDHQLEHTGTQKLLRARSRLRIAEPAQPGTALRVRLAHQHPQMLGEQPAQRSI